VAGRHATEVLPSVIIAVADATNLQRHLYLVTELRELGVPMVLAVTMSDLAANAGLTVDARKLEQMLGIATVLVSSTKGENLDELLRRVRTAKAPEGRTVGGVLQGPPSRSPLPQTPEFIQARYRFIEDVVARCLGTENNAQKLTRRIDSVLLHRVAGPVIMVALFAALFQLMFKGAEIPMDFIEQSVAAFGSLVEAHMADGLLRDMIVNGVIAGVGSVLVFLPQILILFAFIIMFEDSGYMARAAFMLDRMMGGFGLNGRSFIPLLSSFACAIPGIMATRTIESRRSRLTTIMIAPLMTCSARLPVYAMLIGAFVPAVAVAGVISLPALVLFSLYAGAVVAALAIALVARWLGRGTPDQTPFVLELPTYKLPSLRNLALGLWDRARIFLKRAGTVILALSILLWAAATFPRVEVPAALNAQEAASFKLEQSAMGRAGKLIEPVVAPLGYDWKIGICILASFAAREVLLSTLGTVYAVESGDESEKVLTERLHGARHRDGTPVFTLPAVLSLLVFYMLAAQCMSTLAVVRRETNSWRWPAVMFVYMTVLAYGAAWVVYRLTGWLLG
jgi:ferrous iron transport protein B